ncbi:hypothetical protein HK098_007463 [Nowakowskiella sp. JEL0407]|nr:hypothetical protein HK098_007463 [Nowakowskiella sp. JEL0407]
MTTSVSLPSSSEMAQALQQVREEGGLAKAARHMGPSGRRFAANVEKMLTDLQVAIEEKAPDSEFQKIIEYGAEIGSNASPEGIGESLGAAEDAATATARRAAQFAMMLVRMPEFRQDLLDLVQLSQEFLDYNTSEEYDLSKTDVTKLPEKMKETADVASSTASSNAENFTDKLASGQSISETAKSAFDVVTSSITENVPDVVMEEAGKLVRDTAKTVKEGETVAGAVQKVGEERLEQLQEAFKNLKITDEHKKKLLCKFQEIIDHIRGNPEIQRAFGILINSFNDFLHHVQLAAQVAKYRAQQVSGIAQQPLPSMESKYASDVGKSKAELMLTNSKKLIENFAGGRSLDPFLESLRLLVEKINDDNELRGYVDKLVDVLKSPIKIAEGKAHEKSSVSGKDQTEAAGKEKSHGTVTERPEEKHKKSAKTDILPKTAISRSEKKSSKTEKSETEVVEETVEELKETRPDQEIIQVLNDLQVYVSNRYQDEIQSVLFEGQGIMRAIAEDQTLSSLSQDISSISRDLFYDEKTGRPRINVEIWPDVIQILPILADKLAYLPLPRIDSNDEEAHLILDHIFLKCSGILPDRVKISAEVIMEKSETESGVVAVGRNRAQVSLSGIQVSATDIAWMYRKKRGLITWADVGLMDMDIFGEGLNIDLVLDATVPVVEAETGQSKSTVSVRVLQSNVSISGFNVKLKETRHE